MRTKTKITANRCKNMSAINRYNYKCFKKNETFTNDIVRQKLDSFWEVPVVHLSFCCCKKTAKTNSLLSPLLSSRQSSPLKLCQNLRASDALTWI